MTRVPGQVFVMGTSRSGTKWLANLLAAHPQIVGITEPEHGIHESHLFSHTRYYFRQELTREAFISEYAHEDYFKLTGLSQASFCRVAPARGDSCDFFKSIMDEVARERGADYWLEVTPKHDLYYRDILARFPQARFVVIRRDLWAVLKSNLKRYPRPGAPRWLQIAEKVFRQITDMKALARLEQAAPDQVISVIYEDLLEDKTLPLGRICRFLGIDHVSLESEFAADSSFPGMRQTEYPQFSGPRKLYITLLRLAFALVPFPLLFVVRNRRDRRRAGQFPKYTRIETNINRSK